MKKLIILLGLIVVAVVAYYLVSPAFIVTEVNEPLPELNAEEPVAEVESANQTGLMENVTEEIDGQELEMLAVEDRMDEMGPQEMQMFKSAVIKAEGDMTEMEESMPPSPIVAMGDFQERAHDVEGAALLIQSGSEQILRFEDFDTINGPNLHVYLSSALSDDDFIDLGELKATRGSFNYVLDSSIDTDKYDKVLVWCVPFGVLFSYAQLK